MSKTQLGVIFGSRTCEHEVSIISALQLMKAVDREKYDVTPIYITMAVRYPQGGEKQLVYALTHRVVPSGGLPLDCGAMVVNVGSSYALYRAVYEGRPLVDRVVTVSGCVKTPANYLARIGTPVEWLLDTSGGILPQAKTLLYGGPMMGIAINRVDIPVTKGCSGITVLAKNAAQSEESNCIRCGRCSTVCPMERDYL